MATFVGICFKRIQIQFDIFPTLFFFSNVSFLAVLEQFRAPFSWIVLGRFFRLQIVCLHKQKLRKILLCNFLLFIIPETEFGVTVDSERRHM